MPVGQFTKEEVKETVFAVTEMFVELGSEVRIEFVDHYVNIMQFLAAAHTAAPEEEKTND